MKKNYFSLIFKLSLILFLVNISLKNSIGQAPILVEDINPGFNSSSTDNFVVFNGKLYFQADTGSSGTELWEYDGINPSSMIADINPGYGYGDPKALTVYKNKLYFRADNGTNGGELHVYDGVNPPTMVADIYPGFFYGLPGSPVQLIVYKDTLYFAGDDGVTGSELWKYDGVNPPSLAYDINSGGGSGVASFTIYNDTLYFRADDGINGTELWKYDGNTASLVADIYAGTNSSAPNELYVFNNKLYFSADDGVNGTELWVYDDQTQNATLVADINTGSAASFPQKLIEYKNKLYFTSNDGINGNELWSYDGTNPPTMVADIYTGFSNSSFPANYIVYNDTLYFRATDATYGGELWKYDGTNPPSLVADIYPGPSGSFISGPVIYDNKMYFGADDGVVGHELYVINTYCTPSYSIETHTTCDSLVWRDGLTYYTNNTTATDTLTNSVGCDSIITLNLTINNSANTTDTQIACDSLVWIDGNTYYSSNNVATFNLVTNKGCDSIVSLNLTIKNSSQTTDNRTVCDSLVWIDGNTYYTNNNTATYTYTASNGCDSTILLNLTVNNSVTVTDVKIACDSFTWINGMTYYTDNNTALYTLQTANGCDSVVQLDLTINNSYVTIDTINACEAFMWIDGITYNNSNYTASHMLSSTNGCDSLVKLHLTISKASEYTVNIVNCDSAVVNGISYTIEGSYTQVLAAANGCDSTLTINYLKKYFTDSLITTECGGFNLNDSVYTQTGIHQVIIPNCDTIILDLTVNTIDTTYIYDTSCGTYTFNGAPYSYSGTYYNTLRNINRCDSIIVLNLVVNSPSFIVDYQAACDSFTWVNGITYYENTDTAYAFYTKSNGCDSIVQLKLTINKTTHGQLNDVSCIGKTINGQYFDSTGTYTQTLTNTKGCDSLLTVNFIFTNTDTTIIADVCDEFLYDDTVYTTTGIYTRNVNGCSGIVTLDLTIRKKSIINQNVTACKYYIWEGDTLRSSGNYSATYSNSVGCDSIIKLNLVIDNTDTTVITEQSCTDYFFNGITYTNSGTYYDTLVNQNSCDSIIKLNLIITPWENNINDLNLPSSNIGEYLTNDLSSDGKTKGVFISNSSTYTGTVYIYQLSGNTWVPKGAPKTFNNVRSNFDLSSDGNNYTVTIFDNSFSNNRAQVYQYNNGAWVQKGGAINQTSSNCSLSIGVTALSSDGNKLFVIGSFDNSPCFTGSAFLVFGVAVFEYQNGIWTKTNHFEHAHNTMGVGLPKIKLSEDGNTLAMSFVSGFKSFFSSKFFEDHGVAIYQFNGTSWQKKGSNITQLSTTIPNDEDYYTYFDYDISLSSDGSKIGVLEFWYPVLANHYYDIYTGYGALRVFTWNAANSSWDSGTPLIGSSTSALRGPIKISDNGDMVYVRKSEYNLSIETPNTQVINSSLNKYEFNTGNWLFKEQVIPSSSTSYTHFSATGDTIVDFSGHYARKTKTYTKCSGTVVGTDEYIITNSDALNISIYPNPNNGEFSLLINEYNQYNNENISYTLYNSIGKVVTTGNIKQQITPLNISNNANGMYLLQLRIGDIVKTRKVFINN